MIYHYIKLALRHLLKSKGQAIISVLGVAVGILTFSLFGYMGRDALTKGSGFPNHKRFATVEAFFDKEYVVGSLFSLSDIRKFSAAKFPGIEKVAAVRNGANEIYTFQTADGKELPFISTMASVNEAFLEVYSVQLVTGTAAVLFRQPGSVVISESLARKVYGEQDPVGKTVQKEGEVYTVRGVMKDMPSFNAISDPVTMLRCIGDEEDGITVAIVLLLMVDASEEEINRNIKESGLYVGDPSSPGELSVNLLNNADAGRMKETIIWYSVGFLVLLAGLINFFSFIIGSFYNRTRELTLRKTIGASTINLFGLLLTELAILVLLGTCVSLCLSETVIAAAIASMNNVFQGGQLFDPIYMDISILCRHQLEYFVYIMLACTVISCIAILRLQRMPVMQGIRGGSQKGGKHRMRNLMLGFQFFISLLFFGAVSVLHMQYKTLSSSTFSTFGIQEQKRTFEIDLTFSKLAGLEQTVVNQLASAGCVEDVLSVGGRGLSRLKTENFETIEGKRAAVILLQASPNFADFLHLPLLQGLRPENQESVLISKDFSDLLSKEGKSRHFLLNNKNYVVAGEIEPVCFNSTQETSYIVVEPVKTPQYCYLKSRPGQEKLLREHIVKVMRQWIPETLELNIYTFDQTAAGENQFFRIVRNIFLFFALTCLIITSLGIYSAIMLDTESRQKEVAIRKINGATFRTIVFLFGRLYLTLFVVTTAFALPILWLGTNWLLQLFSIRYDVNNPLFWLCVLLMVAALVALIIGYRLNHIARLNPALVIKRN